MRFRWPKATAFRRVVLDVEHEEFNDAPTPAGT
jgi:hypothetical protein